MARIIDSIVQRAKNVFKEKGYDLENNFLLVDRSFNYSYNDLELVKKTSNRRKSSIIKIEQVKCDLIPPYCRVVSHGKYNVRFEDKYGMFIIELKNGKFGVYCRWEGGAGKAVYVDSFLMGDKEFIGYVHALNKRRKKFQEKPKTGIYKTNYVNGIIIYKKYNPDTSLVIHSTAKIVERSVERHFNRLDKRKYHDRTTQLYSCAGTGKTEFLKNLAQKYKNTHSIIFASEVTDMFYHQKLAAKYKVPTIIILEEAEEALMKVSGQYGVANSSVKNLLSGYMNEKNKAGCYKIFTTNHPDRIATTITQRRGRIDETYEFGKLKGNDSYECCKLYLGEDVIKKLDRDSIINLFDNKTGVDIKYTCEDAIEYAEANEKEITIKLLNDIVNSREKTMADMKNFDGEIYNDKSSGMGFGSPPSKNYDNSDFTIENF
jgi:hypothetical protein